MSVWKFRVTGWVRYGPGATRWHWDDAPKPPPAWVRNKRVEDRWTPRTDGKAPGRRLETAGTLYRPALLLDPDKTKITCVRMDLAGTAEALTVDAAVSLVLDEARWTLISVYGWPFPASSKPLDLPELDVRVQPVVSARRR